MAQGARAAANPLDNLYRMLFGQACFVAGTPLLTPDGEKPIDEFRVGDRILSRPEGDCEAPVAVQVVEEIFVRTAPIWALTVGGRTIRTTAEHPFYVQGKGWTNASGLQAGDLLSSHDGQWVSVEAVTDLNEVATVYNLRVSEYHTYFVGADEWGFSVWAHNANYEVFLDTATNTHRLRNVATGEVVRTPLGDAIEFAGTARGRAEATRWLARNNPNIAVPLSEATVGPTLTADELATGLRAERQLGHPLHVSPHVGADFVDTAGRSFEALLQPGASARWATEWPRNIQTQLQRHLAKADFTIIDATGLNASQIAHLTAHVNGLSAAQQAKIVRIGF